MNLNKKISPFVFFTLPCVIFVLFLCQCKKNNSSSISEHTYSINSNTIFLQIISPNTSNTNEKKIGIVVFAEEGEDIDEIKSVLGDFVNNGYKLVFLLADWRSIFCSYKNSSAINNDTNSICNLLNNTLSQDKKFILLTGELGCFSLSRELQSDCVEGIIMLSPYCAPNNSGVIDNNVLNTPTFISVGENDKNSYNFSLQLYQKNHSFCEMRTYPTDEASFILLKSFTHAKEQIKLWIETIMTRND